MAFSMKLKTRTSTAATSPAAKSRGRNFLANASVGQKLMAIVLLNIALLLVVAGTSIVQMNNIGGELASIAEQDIPLTTAVTKIETHQLEQAIYFERSLRYGEEMVRMPKVRQDFEHSVEEFEKLAHQVDREILAGEELAKSALEHAHTPEQKTEFEHVFSALKKIEKEHASYNAHAREALQLLASGRVHEAIGMAHDIEAEEDKLNHELVALVDEIGAFTQNAALTAEAHEKTALRMLIVISLVAVVLGFGLTVWVVRRSVSGPLAQVVGALNALAEGDTTVDVEVNSNDEIGQVAKAFQSFKKITLDARRLAEEQAAAEKRAEEERRAAMLEMADELESGVKTAVDSIAATANDMQSSAQDMSATSSQTSQQATAVAAASEEASAGVQTVAGAAEQLGSSIQEISRQMAETDRAVQNAVGKAGKATDTVSELSEAARRIGEVIDMINDIASQTNLLALNATIEAARAGEAGKGFAVVASEVKNLATQTAKATEEISQQINGVQSVVSDTATAIDEIRKEIEDVSQVASSVASAVEEQSAATSEIASSVQNAASGTQEIASNITGVTDAAARNGETATSVLGASNELSQQSKALRQQVEAFLAQLRAA